MATKFNYKRAHNEWATPEYCKLPQEIKQLFANVQTAAEHLTQLGASNEFSCDLEGLLEDLHKKFDRIEPSVLAHAMHVIYAIGHWDYGKPEERQLPYTRDAYGGNWKFEHLAKSSLIERSYDWTAEKQAYDKIVGQFTDHEEGTEYTNEELAKLFTPILAPEFVVKGVHNVNWRVVGASDGSSVPGRGHPFVIGTQHFPKDSGRYIDVHQAGCAYKKKGSPMCNMPYEAHQSNKAIFLQVPDAKSNKGNKLNLTGEQESKLSAMKKRFKEHKIDGAAFCRPGGASDA